MKRSVTVSPQPVLINKLLILKINTIHFRKKVGPLLCSPWSWTGLWGPLAARYWSKDVSTLEIQHLSAKIMGHKCFKISFNSTNEKNFADHNHYKFEGWDLPIDFFYVQAFVPLAL